MQETGSNALPPVRHAHHKESLVRKCRVTKARRFPVATNAGFIAFHVAYMVSLTEKSKLKVVEDVLIPTE